MSASSNGGKPGFRSFLRGLFSKASPAETEMTDVAVETIPDEPFNTYAEPQSDPIARPTFVPRPTIAPIMPRGAVPSSAPRPATNGLQIPLASIVTNLPLELHGKVRAMDFGQITVTVPLEVVLGQLGSGAVKVPFGLLRRAAPAAFVPGLESDQVMVALPLGEILSRLNPALLTRRPTQRQITISEEVASPFDVPEHGHVSAVGNSTAELSVAPAMQMAPSVSSRHTFTTAPAPTAPMTVPIAAPASPAPGPMRITLPTRPTISARPAAPVVNGTVPPTSTPTPPVAAVPPPPAAPAQPQMLSVMLTSLAEAWPDAVRHEIVRLNLLDARVALPADLVEASLKRGRVAFPWKTVRSWIRPAAITVASPHDAVEVELPLKVLAPLFISRQKADPSKNANIAIDDAIPNLFFGFPKPEAQDIPAAGNPSDSNYYVFDDTTDVAHVDLSAVKRKGPGGTEFIAKCATPNEIVSRAAAIEGVAGALMALPDGLMVASRIPPELNGDTLAAFLPQIFVKVNTATKELRMGELNNLSFTVGNVPWKIFRVNAVFFAAFGRAGEPMKTTQLAALAAELDRKNK